MNRSRTRSAARGGAEGGTGRATSRPPRRGESFAAAAGGGAAGQGRAGPSRARRAGGVCGRPRGQCGPPGLAVGRPPGKLRAAAGRPRPPRRPRPRPTRCRPPGRTGTPGAGASVFGGRSCTGPLGLRARGHPRPVGPTARAFVFAPRARRRGQRRQEGVRARPARAIRNPASERARPAAEEAPAPGGSRRPRRSSKARDPPGTRGQRLCGKQSPGCVCSRRGFTPGRFALRAGVGVAAGES